MYCFRKNPWYVRLSSLTQRASWLLLFTIVVGGCCQNGQRPCEDITPGAIPQPNGTYLCQWNHAETARADRENFVIYQYEWSADGTKLTSFGQEHLGRIAQGLPQVCYPVAIEPASDQRVNEARRLAVLEALANRHVQVAPDRVVLGRSEAEGLYGDEAPGIARRMLSNQGGGAGAGATGGGGSMGGGGAIGGGGGSGVY